MVFRRAVMGNLYDFYGELPVFIVPFINIISLLSFNEKFIINSALRIIRKM